MGCANRNVEVADAYPARPIVPSSVYQTHQRPTVNTSVDIPEIELPPAYEELEFSDKVLPGISPPDYSTTENVAVS